MRAFGFTILALILLIVALLGIRSLIQKNQSALSPTALPPPVPTLTTPTITPLDPSRGPTDARITIVEFSDFQCPYCAQVNQTIETLLRQYPKDIRYVWKDFPNTRIHKKSVDLHIAAHCAGAQGKFWEFHDLLFQNINLEKPTETLITEVGSRLPLNQTQFTDCQKNGRMQALVERNVAEGKNLNIAKTPTFFVNGKRYEGALSLSTFQTILTPLLSP